MVLLVCGCAFLGTLTGGSPRGTPLGQACPCRAIATVMRSIRAWLAPHPQERATRGWGATPRCGCSRMRNYPRPGGNALAFLTTHNAGDDESPGDYPQVGATLGWGLPTVRGPPPGLLKWSNECEQSIAIRV